MFNNPDRKKARVSEQLGEEARNLLRKIVERSAYRQLMLANIRGHGMKLVPEIEEKILLAQDIEHSLRVLQQVELLYAELGGNELALAVRDKMERIPYPVTRLELGMCLSLCDRAERVTAESYVDSASREFAAIALSLLAMDKTSAARGEETLARFCAEAGNRPAAQQMFQRWL